MGAYPTAVYGYYDYDSRYLRRYAQAAKAEDTFKTYQDTYIYGVRDHGEFLTLVGQDRLQAIAADPRTGYSVNMKRD
jgi:glutaconate CoA-transferase subunit A